MDKESPSEPFRPEKTNKGDKSRTRKLHTAAPKRHREVVSAQVRDVLSLLVAFRFINALCVRTFFQPDEYFQALEPAWTIAFGNDSGAWVTWEWQHQLRSSLHPAIFGFAYKAAECMMSAMHLFPPFKAIMLFALPSVVQSVFAALADFYTWKLATHIFGDQSNAPWAALWMTVLNPWQWYCSTRTFSNSLETTLTIVALYYWPWELLEDSKKSKSMPLQSSRRINSLRVSLSLAAIAVLLRPTNIFIWFSVLTLSLTRLTLDGTSPLRQASVMTLLREIILCGATALAVSVVSDRLYFGFWAFPPYKWLYFNVSQSLAVFYGKMPWHYYLSQGIPLLTTTFLPFALVGLYKGTSSSKNLTVLQSNVIRTLSFTVLSMVAVLSLVSHKEVRFIYPVLPILHIVAAPYITTFFTTQPSADTTASPSETFQPVTLRRTISLANMLSINILLAGYLSVLHQPAPISVLNFLRSDFERLHPSALALGAEAANSTSNYATALITTSATSEKVSDELFALFLMPCHSTPWRSHLVYPALRARALTCDPPLDTAPGSVERATYLDEADRFYAKDAEGSYGVRFLADEMWPPLHVSTDNDDHEEKKNPKTRGGEMPRYIVGFEGIEPALQKFFEVGGGEGRGLGVRLRRAWSAWNGAFNEDWRRRGRMVVWDTGVYADSYDADAEQQRRRHTEEEEEEEEEL
ncbi:Alg9-like mannosyltransferase family-domain-containing protein [Podospora didyma]|uniref:Mannosyltransferase n=1 Tax=Podospora didyma TaxID=330526 RepID=A0AAE0KFC7_9PEZI|nr:Alg9-like mannosyltransferase family-domain-containing protein [Podospora didyma]